MWQPNYYCVVPENIFSYPNGRSLKILRGGGGGSQKSKVKKVLTKAEVKFLEEGVGVWRFKAKNILSGEGYGYFLEHLPKL